MSEPKNPSYYLVLIVKDIKMSTLRHLTYVFTQTFSVQPQIISKLVTTNGQGFTVFSLTSKQPIHIPLMSYFLELMVRESQLGNLDLVVYETNSPRDYSLQIPTLIILDPAPNFVSISVFTFNYFDPMGFKREKLRNSIENVIGMSNRRSYERNDYGHKKMVAVHSNYGYFLRESDVSLKMIQEKIVKDFNLTIVATFHN